MREAQGCELLTALHKREKQAELENAVLERRAQEEAARKEQLAAEKAKEQREIEERERKKRVAETAAKLRAKKKKEREKDRGWPTLRASLERCGRLPLHTQVCLWRSRPLIGLSGHLKVS